MLTMSSENHRTQFLWISGVPVLLLFLLPSVILSASAAWGQAVEIGVVRMVAGTAHILREGSELRPAVGDPVREGDILRTGGDGALGIALSDNAVLSIGPETEFHLVEFAFQPRNEVFSFLARVLLGTFVYVSGDIGRLSPGSVSIETPVGVIGIRGTRFAGFVAP